MFIFYVCFPALKDVCDYDREEIERQRASEAYRRLHEAGKTDEARRDMARLAIIRQQREEAAKKRETERKCEWSLCLSLLCQA